MFLQRTSKFKHYSLTKQYEFWVSGFEFRVKCSQNPKPKTQNLNYA
jgi:hypothetical protein